MRVVLNLALVFGAGVAPACAQDAQIAVAANFTAPAQELVAAFAEDTGLEIGLSFGSTGQLYTQITQGAPFDGFLAADAVRPGLLVVEGLAGGQFTYAVGRLALFSRDTGRVRGPDSLEGDFDRLAIAEPDAAPYGAAAQDVIAGLELTDALASKLVIGQNIAQTYQFVDTGNAEMGFVALAQIAGRADGSRWVVPARMHEPIAQDAVVILGAPGADAAWAFLDFLGSAEARAIIQSYGYSVPGQP